MAKTYSEITINGLTLTPTNGYNVTQAAGLFGKTTRSSVQSRTGQDGSFVFNQNWQDRTINLRVSIYGSDTDDYFDKVSAFVSACRKNGNTITITLWNGITRQITGYTLNQPETTVSGGSFNSDTYQVSFVCPNPYFESTVTKSSSVSDFTAGGGVIPSVTGVVLSPSGNSFSINNEGDIAVFPELEVTGKFDSFELTNTTNGQSITITGGLGDNVTLSAETNQFGEFVTVNGSNYKQFFPRELFLVETGVNNLVVTSTGENSNSLVKVTIRERFELVR